MTAVCVCTSSENLELFLPFVVKAAQTITYANRSWDSPAPFVLPVLSRCLIDKVEVTTRACCLTVDTVCKIVEDLPAIIPIMSKLEASVRERDLRVA